MGDRQRILLEHQEGKGVGILGGGGTRKEDPSLAGCFSLVPTSLSPQAQSLLLCP